MRKLCTLVCTLVIFIGNVNAGGYQVRVQGQKQSGMGLTGTSLAWDASSIFYNPGALSFLKNKYSFSLGVSTVFANTTFHKSGSDYTASTDNPLRTPLYFYGSGKISKKFTVGFGIYTPYGSTAKWGKDWEGRYLIQDISLKVFYFQPTLSYQINDKLGIGVGFVYATGDAEINKALPYNSASVNGQVKLTGTASDYGFNAGIFFKATEKLSIGIDYRSKIMMKLKNGDAEFTVPQSIQQMGIPEKNKFNATLPLPSNLDFGISYQVTKKMLVSLELDYVHWSVYDSLTFTFKENPEKLNSHNPRKYNDSYVTRVGMQYTLNNKLALRCGGYYDPTPTNKNYFNPETTSLNTIGITLGMTYKPSQHFDIDFSYLQLSGLKGDRTYTPGNFAGTYKMTTIIPGLGINYHF